MLVAPLPAHEVQRLETLLDLDILDTPPEQDFDDLTRIASFIAGTPIALVSLVDAHRQWFKSRVGLEATETGRDEAFCAHVVHSEALMVVADAHRDDRFADNPLVLGGPKVRFYAGAPLQVDGMTLGTLCVIDHRPRELSTEQTDMLMALSRQVAAQLELRRHIGDLQRSTAARVNELEHKSAVKSAFVSAVAHDLRTPITAIKGSLQLMARGAAGPMPETAAVMMQTAERNCDRLVRLINDNLDLQRIEAGGLQLHKSNFSAGDFVSEAMAMVAQLADQKRVTLRQATEECRIHGDRDRVFQVLVNLLGNAVKFSPEDTAVTVLVSPQEPHHSDSSRVGTRITVRDEGPGIAADKQDLIFKAFSQLLSDQRKHGSGLGLAIAHGIVQSHGGEIEVRSALGEGAEFSFWLPND